MTPDQEQDIKRLLRSLHDETQQEIRTLKEHLTILTSLVVALAVSFVVPSVALFVLPGVMILAGLYWALSDRPPAPARKKHFLWGFTPPPRPKDS